MDIFDPEEPETEFVNFYIDIKKDGGYLSDDFSTAF